MTCMEDKKFIQKAIELSQESVAMDAYPVGAVVVKDGTIVAQGLSNGKQLNDPTSHAEIAAIRAAGQVLGKRNLDDVVLYSSLEPCVMCYAASFWAYIPRVVFACGRDRVAKDHYEGDHNIFDLNEKGRRQIDIVHFSDMEPHALEVIKEWEGK